MDNPFKLTKEEEEMMKVGWVKPTKQTNKNNKHLRLTRRPRR